MTDTRRTAGISDSAVRKATGKDWPQWCTVLDRAGARETAHKDIARYLHRTHGLSAWWSQMVTVGYEQVIGRRKKHQKPSGFEVSRSRTIDVSVRKAYNAWRDARVRQKWLDARPLLVRTATANKSLRLTWIDGEQILSVHFNTRGRSKSQVVVQHTKLPSARAAERTKRFWGSALEALKSHLES